MGLIGVEWLRYACRLLLLCKKYAPPERGCRGDIREALRCMPLGKQSDSRNKFLSLLEQTHIGGAALRARPGTEEFGTEMGTNLPDAEGAAALWRGGLRLGALLDLEPWTAFL